MGYNSALKGLSDFEMLVYWQRTLNGYSLLATDYWQLTLNCYCLLASDIKLLLHTCN